MCLLGCVDHLPEKKNINIVSADWSYDDQESWKQFPNYYSTMKTPINIKTNKVYFKKNNININYVNNVKGFKVIDHNTPYFLLEQKDNNNYILYNDDKYKLIQFHFHNSSENTINDVYYPVEVHFVHTFYDPIKKITKYIAVALLLQKTDKKGLNITKNFFNNMNYTEINLNLEIFNKLTCNSYYNFIGTVTTPPFVQNVSFNLFTPEYTKNINLTINETDYDEFVSKFFNNKDNNLSKYNENRYNLNDNFLVVNKIYNTSTSTY